jgi:uncharacterized membrane protein YhaH (DUF805 family)
MNWMTVLFSGQGRLRRRHYWIAMLVLAAISAPFRLLGPVGGLVTLLLVYPQICIFAKRLHDVGRSGWQTLAPFGLMLGGALLFGFTESAGGVLALVGGLVGGVLVLAGVVFSLWVAFHPGDPGENRYGPSPKLQADPSVFA